MNQAVNLKKLEIYQTHRSLFELKEPFHHVTNFEFDREILLDFDIRKLFPTLSKLTIRYYSPVLENSYPTLKELHIKDKINGV